MIECPVFIEIQTLNPTISNAQMGNEKQFKLARV